MSLALWKLPSRGWGRPLTSRGSGDSLLGAAALCSAPPGPCRGVFHVPQGYVGRSRWLWAHGRAAQLAEGTARLQHSPALEGALTTQLRA